MRDSSTVSLSVLQRLRAVVANYGKLLIASRNLDFFTSFYKYLIQLLPAAVVAPLFFAGGRGCEDACTCSYTLSPHEA
jgi:ABC-type uncharacterized transport system fused permease/ATPase subunit